MMKRITEWLVRNYMPGYHIAKNPVRTKKKTNEELLSDHIDAEIKRNRLERQLGIGKKS